ncbi:MAG: WG repeat-containing protein [Malacoplasma sp.]|nr:WG repeat-containing protein [Malacoplasma sp.]
MAKQAFIYEKNNLFGFYNNKNQIIIEAQFQEVREMNDNFAWVKKDNKWNWIDNKNNLVLPNQFDNILFYNPKYSVVQNQNESYLVLHNSKKVSKIPYQFVDFNDEILLVKHNNKYFYLNLKLEKLFDNQFENATIFIDQFASVCQNKKWGIVNKKGRIIVDFQYDKIYQNGSFLFKTENNSQTFFIDLHNSKYLETLDNQYLFNDAFCDDVIVFKKNHKFGVMNDFFEVLFYKNFSFLDNFKNGVAIFEKDTKFGLINKKGHKLVGNIFDKILWIEHDYLFGIKNNKYCYFIISDKKIKESPF